MKTSVVGGDAFPSCAGAFVSFSDGHEGAALIGIRIHKHAYAHVQWGIDGTGSAPTANRRRSFPTTPQRGCQGAAREIDTLTLFSSTKSQGRRVCGRCEPVESGSI